MKVLIISSFFPYPAYFGGAFDILNRIKEIKSLGHEIDLICTCKEFPEEKNIYFIKQFVNEVLVVSRKNRVIDLFSKNPLQVVSRKELKTISLQKEYDYAILESENVGAILDNKNLRANKIIVRVHNDESEYFYQLGKSTQKYRDKIYYYIESFKFKTYSKKIFNKADRLWFISNKEIFNDRTFHHKAIHLPTPVNNVWKTQELANKQVLFVGALFMPNNLEAIMWYLNNVHNFLLKEENYKLIIVGSTNDLKQEFFYEIFKNYTHVEVRLNEDDLTSFYSEATIFINPMLHGAGVKLKSINAIQNGLVLISSSIGIEGTGLIKDEMYFEANSPEDFLNTILKVFNMRNEEKQMLLYKAQEFLKQNNPLSILEKEIYDEKK